MIPLGDRVDEALADLGTDELLDPVRCGEDSGRGPASLGGRRAHVLVLSGFSR